MRPTPLCPILYYEDGDEVEEGGVLAVFLSDTGTCEIVAPASGVIISWPNDEGDTAVSEAVLAKIPRDR